MAAAGGDGRGVRVLAALAPATMLVVDPGGWYPFGPSKWLVASTVALVGAALVLRTRPVRVPDPIAAALAFLLAWLVIAAAVGAEPIYGWIGTPERRFGVVTWGICVLLLIVGRSLDVRRDGATLVTGLLVAGAGVGAVATLEALGWEPDVLDVGRRLTGTFGSSAYLGAATALLLPVALGVALGGGSARRRGLAAAASGLLAIACLGSGARSAWFGLAVAGIATAIASFRPLLEVVKANRQRALAIGGAAAVLAVGLLVLSPVGNRLEDTTDVGPGGARGRVDEWQVGTKVLRGNPVLGVGPESYRTAFDDSVDYHYVVTHGREVQPDRSHNGPLDLALAAGLPALFAWAVLAWYTVRSAWSALAVGPGWLRGVAAGLIAHGVGQLFLFPVIELEPVAWLLAGLLLAARPRGAAKVTRRPGKRQRPVPTVVVGLLLLGATVALVSGATEVVADHRAEEAADSLARGDGAGAYDAAQSAADLRPDVLRLHLLAARAAVAADEGFDTAIGHVDDALDLSPDDPIAELALAGYLVDRAEATGTRGHLVDAVREIERRVLDDALDPRVWALFVRLAELAGDEDAADQARENIEILTPVADR